MNDDGARDRSAAGSVDGAEPAGGGQDFIRRTAAEDAEFVRAIADDVRWLGFDWGERLR